MKRTLFLLLISFMGSLVSTEKRKPLHPKYLDALAVTASIEFEALPLETQQTIYKVNNERRKTLANGIPHKCIVLGCRYAGVKFFDHGIYRRHMERHERQMAQLLEGKRDPE